MKISLTSHRFLQRQNHLKMIQDVEDCCSGLGFLILQAMLYFRELCCSKVIICGPLAITKL